MSNPGGVAFTFQGSVFSHNATYILAPAGCSLKLFSALTGGLVGTLEGHDADITCVATAPKESTQVYTASRDGTIKLWDYIAMECIRTYEIRETVMDMVFSLELPIAYLSIHWRDGSSGRIIAYDLDKGKAGRTAMKTSKARPLFGSGASLGSSSATTFVATFDKHSLFVWRVGQEIYQPLNLHHTKPYTCAAISADESLVAAGDATGRILVWRNFGPHVPTIKQESQQSYKHHAGGLRPTTMHWHASAVGCLTFSSDGVYLLSGGREGVLVLWQLESNKQSFLPRLGGPLARLQPSPRDPARYLLSQEDNTLRVINTAAMKVEASVLGLRPPPAGIKARVAASATLLQPGTGHLMVPCENGEMQIFDTVRSQHVSLVRIINRNSVAIPATTAPHERHQQPAAHPTAQPYVEHAAFTEKGYTLVTVDVRPAAGAFGKSSRCLKFWDLSNSSTRTGLDAPFTLNTRVDEPHAGSVRSVSVHPTADIAVTTGGEDMEFKVWERPAAALRPNGKPGKPGCWRCRSLGGYKNLPLTASAFSPDGSALAVAAGPKVTIWDPLACQLVTVLSLAPEHQAVAIGSSSANLGVIQKVAFVPGTPYVVACSELCLAVWNLLTASLHWVLDMPTSTLAVDPLHSCFAVVVPMPALHDHTKQQPAAKQRQPEGAQTEPAAAAPAAAAATVAAEPAVAEPAVAEPAEPAATPAEPAAGAAGLPGWSASDGKAPVRVHHSHVLVFDPKSPAPRYHCICPGTLSPVLLFAQPGMPQHGSAGAGSSPLLVLTERRSYQYVLPPGASMSEAAPTSDGAAAEGDPSSRYEAAFGPMKLSSGAAAPVEGMDVDADPSRPRWKELFDAPSHALPAPTVLAHAFLRLINAE